MEINGKAAFLVFVSPGQINLQAPDDTARGTVSVVVTTAAGSATSTVTLSEFAPSFALLDAKHVSGIILRRTIRELLVAEPTISSARPEIPSAIRTVAAQAGDTVELYGVGFGPTTPSVPAGQPFSGAAPINNLVSLYINNVLVKPTFVGLSSAGLYQINLTVPRGLGTGDVPIQAVVGGMATQMGVFLPLQAGFAGTSTVGGTGGTGGTGEAADPDSGLEPAVTGRRRRYGRRWRIWRRFRGRIFSVPYEEPRHMSPDCDLRRIGRG